MLKDRKYPTLYVKNFAKIKEAEIELAPFTLFIGDNNSGKSYLMTLIYGLIKYIYNIINIIFKNDKLLNSIEEYSKVKNIINTYINSLHSNKLILEDKFEEDIKLRDDEIKEFINLFNALLNKNIKNVVNYIFNTNNDEIILENIILNFDCYTDKLFSIEKTKVIDRNMKEINSISILYNNTGAGYNFSEDNIDYTSIIKIFLNFIINTYFNIFYNSNISINNEDNIYFLPTARTGYLLLYTDIIKYSIKSKYDAYALNKENQGNNLPRHAIDFLFNFADLPYRKMKKKQYIHRRINQVNIIKMLETDIIDGKVDIDEEIGSIYYQPNHVYNSVPSAFPIHLCSSVITELTPLILFLKYYGYYKNIIMEEPEISLHPYLQQQLTRAFIKLVNSGKNVLITTHSDTIVQHINNMIKLNANEKKRQKKLMEKYKYDEDDIISEDKIRMYQFDAKEDGTEVKPLESSKYGFEAPTFHNYLIKVSNEFDSFIGNIDNSDE